jgi:hypothetical protein
MVINTTPDICKIDAYLDADFAEMYGHEKPANPTCVKHCTGLVIAFTDVAIL